MNRFQINRGAFGRILRTVAFAGALAPIGLYGAAGVEAASPTTGLHFRSEVECKSLNTSIGLTALPPLMQSVPAYSAGNVVYVGPNHMQWVGFRQWLLRWNNSSRAWEFTDQNRDRQWDSGPLFQAQVGNNGSYVPLNDWFNTTTKRYGAGLAVFPVRDAGYYRVATEYFWYADALTGFAYDYLWAGDYLHNTDGEQSSPWCQY
jgi:hypothetical protein